jgi:hypothetical protein
MAANPGLKLAGANQPKRKDIPKIQTLDMDGEKL